LKPHSMVALRCKAGHSMDERTRDESSRLLGSASESSQRFVASDSIRE
jgi:hypothetical protein